MKASALNSGFEGPPLSPAQATVWYPGLDGVRGFAVFLVFAVHYIPMYRIGWMGVLTFFVLSGFLITGVLYDSRQEQHRFRNFYVRRALRIFPLFYFIWLFILISGFFFHAQWRPMLTLWPIYLGNYARFIGGATTAYDRIYTALPTVPFEISHFWSLAVEEQFYFLWPIVVFKVQSRQILMRICMAVIILVLLLRTALVHVLPQSFMELYFLYQMTFSQADAFLMGGLLALLLRGPEKPAILRAAPSLFWGALAALILACWLNGPGQYWGEITPLAAWMSSYGFTLIDITSGGLILCSLIPGNPIFQLMSYGPLRRLGKYSYGFYVYHQFLRPFLEHFLRERHWGSWILLSVPLDFLIVFAISAASYHILEMPFLRLKTHFSKRHATLELAKEHSVDQAEVATVTVSGGN